VPRVLRSIRDAGTNAVVALDGETMLGFGIMKYDDEEAHLLLLAVHAAAARRGVGRALVQWLEAVAMVAGVGQVYLEARVANGAARAFYGRLGYREIQHLAGYYQGREAAVRLAKDLWVGPDAPA
jgi:ribosomal-protein-alanine N-acetyltransferase